MANVPRFKNWGPCSRSRKNNRYKAALFRHLVAFESGQIRDPETGCLHLAQVVWNALAMLHFSLKK